MTTVGVRDLKNRLSEYLRRVGKGERIVVTDRNRPVAVLSPPTDTSADEGIRAMLREGLARWSGGKPRGSDRPVKIRGTSIAETVIEERR